MASTYLTRTGGTPTSTKKFTISFWVKKCKLGGDEFLVSTFTDANNRMQVDFNSSDNLTFICYASGSLVIRKRPNRKLRDPSAWLHVVVAVDTTQASASDRCKIYFNGEQETSWSIDTNPSQNADVNVSGNHFIGAYDNGGSPALFFTGLLSHVHYTDGYFYDASTFGSTDNLTGEWKINPSPSVSYGTNGYFVLKDGNSATDQSGQSNNFTVGGGTLTKTLDSPSNNFATLNVLQPSSSVLTITNGNTHIYSQSPNSWTTTPATLAIPTTSKIYWEIKCIGVWGSSFCQLHGIVNLDNISQEANNVQASDSSDCYGWKNDGSFKNNGSTVSNTSWASSYTTNDILMFALDNSNGALYVGKNGSWLNSGDPTSGASKTGALPVTAGLTYAPHSETKYGSDKPAYNFGNGVFVSTAITTNSGNGYAGAEGKSKFNYQPPTGYSALTTLGMNE